MIDDYPGESTISALVGASLSHFHPAAEIILTRSLIHLPLLGTVVLCALLLAHGPIAQLPHYHQFADHSVLLGVPQGAAVLSNPGFAVVAL
jgi:hypothetical protein